MRRKKSRYEYQGDMYRGYILDIRECDRLLELFRQAGEYANPVSVERIERFRDELFAAVKKNFALDERDVAFDVENFERAKRTTTPIIRPTICTL